MERENLMKLVGLLKQVIGEGHFKVATIGNKQYESLYLPIFFDEIQKNHGEATAYDRFGEQLWTELGVDINEHEPAGEELSKFGLLGKLCMMPYVRKE
jgi:hypothetical protein